MELPSSVAARPNNARARAAAAWSVTVGAQQVTMPGAEGAKAACEGCRHLESGKVPRHRDWHGPAHLGWASDESARGVAMTSGPSVAATLTPGWAWERCAHDARCRAAPCRAWEWRRLTSSPPAPDPTG